MINYNNRFRAGTWLILIVMQCFAGLIACRDEQETKVSFYQVLILGNSITRHPPAPQIGWYGDWGMAASAREKDFVHLLMADFKAANPQTKVNYQNISEFERTFWMYDLSRLDTLKALNPDLLIIRIGENVDTTALLNHNFEKHYTSLIRYFKQQNPQVKIICVSNFWRSDAIEHRIAQCSANSGSAFVKLSGLTDVSYTAWGQFENFGVATHPSDKGMQAIADLIWAEVEKF